MLPEKLFSLTDIVTVTGGNLYNPPRQEIAVNAVVTDSRRDCSEALFLALVGERFDAHDFLMCAVEQQAAALCVNHSAVERLGLAALPPLPVIAVPDTLLAYQQLAACHRRRFPDLKIIAVTGSMGKTSTKEIIKAILSAEFGVEMVYASQGNTNNQIGVPLNLLQLNKKHRAAVIEIGTNHHGEVEPLSRITAPNCAVITTIGACHLEFFKDLAGVAREKAKIFTGLQPGGIAVFPAETPQVDYLQHCSRSFCQLQFGDQQSSAAVRVKYLRGNLTGSELEIFLPRQQPFRLHWPLTGAHQAMNAAAAIAAVTPLAVSRNAIIDGLSNCCLPGMRMKIIERNGITWLNDAYNASPGSMRAVIDNLAEFVDQKNTLLILGDMLELGEQSAEQHCRVLEHCLKRLPRAEIFAVGPAMSRAASSLNSAISTFPDAESAGAALRRHLAPGMLLLLKGSRGMRLEMLLEID